MHNVHMRILLYHLPLPIKKNGICNLQEQSENKQKAYKYNYAKSLNNGSKQCVF